MNAKKIIVLALVIYLLLPQIEGIKPYNSCSQYTRISPMNASQNEEPSIDQDTIIWTTKDNVLAYSITNKTTKSVTNTAADKHDAIISQGRVLWVEFAEDAQIYSCELSKNGNAGGCEQDDAKIKITSEFGLKQDISLFFNKAVWEQFDGNDFEIVLCDFSLNNATGGCQENDRKTKITNNSLDDRNPVIFGRYVVWNSGKNPDINIEYYDLETNTTTVFVKREGNQQKPKLYYENGDYFVVYESNEFNNDDILYQKIGDNTTYQLTNGQFDEGNPVVDNRGKSVFWLSSKFGYAHAEGIVQEGFIDASLRSTFKQDHLAVFNKTLAFEAWNQSQSEIWMAQC